MKKCFYYSIAIGGFLLVTLSAHQLLGTGEPGMISSVPSSYNGRPFSGSPLLIPGRIEAESYDVTTGNAKGVTVGYQGELRKTAYRPDADSAGLARFGTGHVSITGQAEAPDQVYVGWTETSEWLAYTVRVNETGTYIIGGKFAAGDTGSMLSISFSSGVTTGLIEIPTTAGYQPRVEVYHVWETLDHLKEVNLPSGVYVMKVNIEKSAGLNLDYMTFVKKP